MKKIALSSLVLAAACGGEPSSSRMQVALREAAMPCNVPGLQARLEVTGRPEPCPLDINADRTVTGMCPAVPVGQVLEFRLVYFLQLLNDPMPVDLATALKQLDLTSAGGGGSVQLSFEQSDLNTMIDDDQDNETNLSEVCAGRNPRGS